MILVNFQKAIFEKLEEVFGEDLVVGDSYNEDTPMPYIFLGDLSYSDESSKTEDLKEVTAEIVVFSNFNGKEEAFELSGKVVEGLKEITEIEEATLISARVTSVQVSEQSANSITGYITFVAKVMTDD